MWEDPSFLKCNESGSVKIYMLQHLKFRILDIYRKTLSQLVRECKIENADNEVVYNGILDEHNERELINIIHEALDTQPQIVKKVFWLSTTTIPFLLTQHQMRKIASGRKAPKLLVALRMVFASIRKVLLFICVLDLELYPWHRKKLIR